MTRYTLTIIRDGEAFEHWRGVVSFAPQRWAPQEPIQVVFADGHRMTVFPGTATVVFEEDVSARPKQRARRRETPMIRKTASGHQVVSEKGKPLSKPNLTRAQAEDRLRQVEYFKHRGKKDGR